MPGVPTWLAVFSLILGAVGTAGIGGMFKAWLDHKRGTRKDTDEVALALVTRLESRVEKLEGDLEKERARCDAELGVHRHVNKNQRTMIYSLLHLFDMPATRRKGALAGIRADLAAMELAEAHEKATIAAAPLMSAPEGGSKE